MHARLMECSRCGILYGNPVLSPGALATAYQTAEFDSAGEADYASNTYARRIRNLLPVLPDLNGALDIGTGDGAFLEKLLHLRFQNVVGVEPSEAPIESAKKHIRPLIRSGLFRSEKFAAASFSLITCFQTMEHVWDPLETAMGAYRLLKSGGAVAIVVHNRKSLSARILGMKSPIFDIEHLQLFCPSTGKRLLEQAGFRNVAVSTIWNRYPLRYWAKLLPFPAPMKSPLLRLLKESTIGTVPVAMPAGNLICIGFK
jgi:SAM-dependent methyltransferase